MARRSCLRGATGQERRPVRPFLQQLLTILKQLQHLFDRERDSAAAIVYEGSELIRDFFRMGIRRSAGSQAREDILLADLKARGQRLIDRAGAVAGIGEHRSLSIVFHGHRQRPEPSSPVRTQRNSTTRASPPITQASGRRRGRALSSQRVFAYLRCASVIAAGAWWRPRWPRSVAPTRCDATRSPPLSRRSGSDGPAGRGRRCATSCAPCARGLPRSWAGRA